MRFRTPNFCLAEDMLFYHIDTRTPSSKTFLNKCNRNSLRQMQINLSGQIVILDEAHNIEDSAREAGSFSLSEHALANTTSDLEFLISDGIKVDDHQPLHLLCTRFKYC